jgi:hypothetical protein
LGWTVGRNLRIDYRWGAGDPDLYRQYAAELLALAPDVILANSSAALASLLQATRTVPIVFTTVADPVGAGYVDSLGRPGGNATGFLLWEYSIAAKWLELLKEIAPHVTRAMVFRQSAIAAVPGQFGVIQAAAPSLGVDLRGANSVSLFRQLERSRLCSASKILGWSAFASASSCGRRPQPWRSSRSASAQPRLSPERPPYRGVTFVKVTFFAKSIRMRKAECSGVGLSS